MWVASQRPVLGVPLVHREAVDPDVGEDVRIGEGEAVGDLDAQTAEDVRGDVVRVGDDQDQVALAAPARSMIARRVSSDRNLAIGPLSVATGLEREVGQALCPEPAGAIGQLVDLASGDAGHARGDDRLDPAAAREGVSKTPNPDAGAPPASTSAGARSTSSMP